MGSGNFAAGSPRNWTMSSPNLWATLSFSSRQFFHLWMSSIFNYKGMKILISSIDFAVYFSMILTLSALMPCCTKRFRSSSVGVQGANFPSYEH